MSTEPLNITSTDFEQAKRLIIEVTDANPGQLILQDGNGFYYNRNTGVICNPDGKTFKGRDAFENFFKTINDTNEETKIFFGETNRNKTEGKTALTLNMDILAKYKQPFNLELPEELMLLILGMSIEQFNKLSPEEFLATKQNFIENASDFITSDDGAEKEQQVESLFFLLYNTKKNKVDVTFTKDYKILNDHPDKAELESIFPDTDIKQLQVFKFLLLAVENQKREQIILGSMREGNEVYLCGLAHLTKKTDLDDLSGYRSILVAMFDKEEDLLKAYEFDEGCKEIYNDHILAIKRNDPKKNFESLPKQLVLEKPDYAYDATNEVFIKVNILSNPNCLGMKISATICETDDNLLVGKKDGRYIPLTPRGR